MVHLAFGYKKNRASALHWLLIERMKHFSFFQILKGEKKYSNILFFYSFFFFHKWELLHYRSPTTNPKPQTAWYPPHSALNPYVGFHLVVSCVYARYKRTRPLSRVCDRKKGRGYFIVVQAFDSLDFVVSRKVKQIFGLVNEWANKKIRYTDYLSGFFRLARSSACF